jgi:Ni/Fe-hydrogenase subunit HybB-like protein
VRRNRGGLFISGVLLVLAGTVYRFDTYLIAYKPTTGWVYFPSLGELLFSACLASTGIAVYIVMIKLFPILSGVPSRKKPTVAGHTAQA